MLGWGTGGVAREHPHAPEGDTLFKFPVSTSHAAVTPLLSKYCVPQNFVATSIDHGEARVQCEDMEGSGAWSREDDA